MIIDVLNDFTENYVLEKETKIAKKALEEIREERVSNIFVDLDRKIFEIDSPSFYGIGKTITQNTFDWLLRNIAKVYNVEFIYKEIRNGRKRG